MTCSGNTIAIEYQGGHGSSCLVEDTTIVAKKPYAGFSYSESAAQAELPVVTGYSLGCRSVTLTLDRNCDTDGRVQYAHHALPTLAASPTHVGTVGGNIRNADDTLSRSDGTPLYDWGVGFDLPLTACPSCATSPLWTWASEGSLLADNSPARWAAADHVPEIDGAGQWSVVYWIRGNGSIFSSGSGSTHVNQWAATTQRQLLIQGSGSDSLQIFWPGSLTDSGNSWLSAASAFAACDSAWCMIAVVGDGSGGTPDAKLDVYACIGGTCNEISTAGAFTGAWAATTLPAAGRGDFAIGARSGGGSTTNMEYTIAHAQWWSTNLSSANVASLYNSGTVVDPRTVASGPCHYWPLGTNGKDIGSCPPIPVRPYGADAVWSALHP